MIDKMYDNNKHTAKTLNFTITVEILYANRNNDTYAYN